MQGVHLIDSSLAHVSCDLCCVQAIALAMPTCKWASGVCMKCVWSGQRARSPWKAGLSDVRRGWMVPSHRSSS